MLIKFKRLRSNAKMPTRAKNSDAGYDLYATEFTVLSPFERKVIPTGIAVEIPEGYYGRIAPRSGLAAKFGIDVLAGVIDSGYRNEIGVILINFSVLSWLTKVLASVVNKMSGTQFIPDDRFEIHPGDRVAQLIVEKCHDVEWVESEELSDSERGQKGFGSTG